MVASAQIEEPPGRPLHLTLTLRTAGVEETRALDAPTCSALAEASAVVIALAMDPSRHGSVAVEQPTVEQPAPEQPSAAASPPVSPPQTGPKKLESPPPGNRAAPSRWPNIALGFGGSAQSGPLPDIGVGFVGSASLRMDRYRAGVLATLWSRQSPMFSDTAGASFDMREVGVFGSYMVPLGALAIGPSATLDVTYMRVEGFGIRAPRTTSHLWPTAGLGGRLEARLAPRLSLFSTVDLRLPIGAPTVALATSSNTLQLHEPSPVGVQLSLGAEFVIF
ncbi:hypothetical protein AKJ09_06863 [Labilithrix luteola]|uniref:Outer membrane protein beta-barrel domain-containing protein n=1 Tax=Labilithrix luteola TaxID=1391654 RepID=A0A0K1Q489_9BACT|nr:hypothetical protein AKJ09_06863 [Labilithrix luteola]